MMRTFKFTPYTGFIQNRGTRISRVESIFRIQLDFECLFIRFDRHQVPFFVLVIVAVAVVVVILICHMVWMTSFWLLGHRTRRVDAEWVGGCDQVGCVDEWGVYCAMRCTPALPCILVGLRIRTRTGLLLLLVTFASANIS